MASPDRVDPSAFCDDGPGELAVVYTFGPEFGRRIVMQHDLDQLQLHPRALRHAAYQHLEVLSSRAEFHGQPPALMLSFEGLESSLLLASDFWTRLEGAVPGELVVGVPTRDCVVVTGSQSGPGLDKARKCVERLFFAGSDNLLSRSLLVRRGGTWEPFDRPARPGGARRAPAHQHGVGQPPRQFQEHPSWPGQQVPPQHTGSLPRLDQTGSVPRIDQTGSIPRMGIGGPIPGPPAIPQQQPSPFSTGTHPAYTTGTMPAVGPDGQPVSGTAPAVEGTPYKAGPYAPAVLRREDEMTTTGIRARATAPEPVGAPERRATSDRYGYGRREEAYEREQQEAYEREQYERRERDRQERDRQERDRLEWERRERDYERERYERDRYERDRLEREQYDRDRQERDRYDRERRPSYPEAWGSAPEDPSTLQFRSGPRARFSR